MIRVVKKEAPPPYRPITVPNKVTTAVNDIASVATAASSMGCQVKDRMFIHQRSTGFVEGVAVTNFERLWNWIDCRIEDQVLTSTSSMFHVYGDVSSFS